MRIRLAVLLAVLLAAVSIGIAAADDPMVGTWKLNPSESRYSPGPAPEDVVMTVEPAGRNAGDVEWQFQKQDAERVVRRLSGVRANLE